jgi:D-alanyl-lipoteichoic acid acyltransferase DltB (MBOAT superfamily)
MLAAGPIAAFEDHSRKPFEHVPLRKDRVIDGLELIARGLFNKFVICYILDQVFLQDFQSTGPAFILEMLVFTFWSYLDFSAYSMIALGIGYLAGVPTPINFRNPFAGRNLIDFWDRWHISLSTFVKNNVFMPIYITLMRRPGPSRPLLYASVATMVSFVLVGLWHGLSLGWFLWGFLHAIGLVIVRYYGHFLQTRLSPSSLKRYRQSVGVRAVATVITYAYITFAFYPVAVLSHVRQ